MIEKYFEKQKKNIYKFSHIIENYQLNEKIYSEVRGIIDGELIFINESKLDFAELKDIELKSKIKYHYHYMDCNNNMFFRYDNAKHYNELKTFPHHKHIINEVKESYEPELLAILTEIESLIFFNNISV